MIDICFQICDLQSDGRENTNSLTSTSGHESGYAPSNEHVESKKHNRMNKKSHTFDQENGENAESAESAEGAENEGREERMERIRHKTDDIVRQLKIIEKKIDAWPKLLE